MAEQDRDPQPDGAAAGDSTTGTPRWVKIFGAVALLVVVLLVVMLLFGGGNHGPGRHSGNSNASTSVDGRPPGGTQTNL